jgi:histidyl-tRNA synthetase
MDMSVELRNLKGTFDYLPQEQKVRDDIIRKLKEVFGRYGYQPLETPIVGYFDVLASKYAGGSEILKEVFKLNDQGGRELGLRYDLTVPFARVVGMNPGLRLPFKRYEIGKVFRDGPVKTGRNREFIQCDVDIVGVGSVMAEAELLMMADEVYGLLGLEVFISYNNRKLLSGLLEAAGVPTELTANAILSVDKLAKIGQEAVRAELMEKGAESSSVDRLFVFMGMGADDLQCYFKDNSCYENIREGLAELEGLSDYIRTAGMDSMMQFTPSLARGLEIYTGTVWEVFLKDGSITSSIGAGGRYDRIIGEFLDNGMEYPAVGMTFGLDVIYEALRLKGLTSFIPPADLYLIPLDTEREVMGLAKSLRKQGIRVDVEMNGRKLKKALEYANKQGIPYVIVMGENEVAEQKVRIKDMKKGAEYEVEMGGTAGFFPG